jgi:hypothetical protein
MSGSKITTRHPSTPEITAFAVGANGTRNRGFDLDGVRVLVSGDDDAQIAAVAFNLANAGAALEQARARHVELQAEIERVESPTARWARLHAQHAQLSAAPPKRPARLLGPGVVRFDPAMGKPWLLNKREPGWSSWGVVCDDWDDLFRRFNVRVTGHGTDEHGAWWEVTPIIEEATP